jgi:hypothetical protein
MTEMIVVEDRNQDDMSRKAGCYLYADTRLWLEDDLVHQGDGGGDFTTGSAPVYQGKDVTRDVNTFFFQNKWPCGAPRHGGKEWPCSREFLKKAPWRPRRGMPRHPFARASLSYAAFGGLGLERIDRNPGQPKHAATTSQRLVDIAGLVAQAVEPLLRAEGRRPLADLNNAAVGSEADVNEHTLRFHLSLLKILDARAEAQQFNRDILGAQHLCLAGKARLRANAWDGIEPFILLAGYFRQALAPFLHEDVAASAFGLPLALVENAYLRTQKR